MTFHAEIRQVSTNHEGVGMPLCTATLGVLLQFQPYNSQGPHLLGLCALGDRLQLDGTEFCRNRRIQTSGQS